MSDDAPRRHGADLRRHAAGLGTVGTDGKVGELGYRMGVPILAPSDASVADRKGGGHSDERAA